MAQARLKAIILEQSRDDGTYRVCVWANVPTARQPFYASSGNTSAWSGATAPDIASLVDGSVAEKVVVLRLAPSESLATLRGAAMAEASAWQGYVNAINPWARYGTTWDGTTWVVGGVA